MQGRIGSVNSVFDGVVDSPNHWRWSSAQDSTCRRA